MPKTKDQKKEIVKKLSQNLTDSKGVVFSTYMGLTVSEMEELRSNLREQDTELMVAKRTLLKKALAESKLEDVDMDAMEGGVAIVTGPDEVQPAKVMDTFAKDHEAVQFFGGIMEGKFIDTAKVKTLAALPTKEELYAKMVGSMNAPVSGFVNVLAGNLRGLVNALSAIKDQKE